MRIGELAARTATPVDTVRYYESLGLLPRPARTGANYRSYSESDVERLHFVRRCRALDMSLDEIRALLVFCDEPSRPCGEVNALLDEHIGHVEQRIEELQRLAGELRSLRSVCQSPGHAVDCEILRLLGSRDTGAEHAALPNHPPRAHGARPASTRGRRTERNA